MAESSLSAIQTKVRRITRSPSESQLTTTQLNEYINTFVEYDFPEHLRLFALRTTLTFYTSPFVDVYETNTTDQTSPLYNFKNKYITIHDPIYIAGYPAFFSQDRTQFFGIYPIVRNIMSIGAVGNGVKQTFSGFVRGLNSPEPSDGESLTPILQRHVLFSSVDNDGDPLALVDTPISPKIGNLSIPNQAPTSLIVQDENNYIDYLTGEFTITFSEPPADEFAINSQTVPYVPALPQALLYYDNKFTVRPVPDQPYPINMEVYIRPTELLQEDAATQSPELQQWWQYIAYGAAKKIFEDRMDMESLQMIMPEFKKQEMLVQRRTIVQQTQSRAPTIYTEQSGPQASNGWWGGWGGNF